MSTVAAVVIAVFILGTTSAQTPGSVTVTASCHSTPADLVFLLDSSGSEGTTNFQKQLQFVSNLVDRFDIGPDKVQVSLATFSASVSNAFWLNQYQTKAGVIAGIKNATYGGTTTATDLALNHALTQTFSPANGARNNSNKIIIVLTDGQSTNAAQTVAVAKKIHNTDIKVIAIGIGSNIDRTELATIATDNDHVFTVANFSSLASIEKEVEQTTCKSEIVQVASCHATPADLVFLLDASGSEGSSNFQDQLQFVSNLVNRFDIGPDKVQVSLATFSDSVSNTFWLNEYQTKAEVLAGIKKATYSGMTTATDLALNHALTQTFSPANGARNNSNKIIIVLTDGQSTNAAQTAAVSKKIHNTNIKVIAIGIGDNIDPAELDLIATDNSHVFTVANFSSLASIEKEVEQTTCKSEVVAASCHATPADLVFLLDASGSEGTTNFQDQLQFVSNLVSGFDIGPDKVQVSLATFSDSVNNTFWLNQYQTKAEVLAGIKNAKYRGWTTATDLALNHALTQTFSPANGARNNSNKIIIVLTDGQSTNSAQTVAVAKKIHNTNIKVIAIGIGSNIDPAELATIATDNDHVFRVANFSSLASIEKEVEQTTCKSEVVPPSCHSTPADLVFLLDSSGSEGTTNFQKQLQFVSNLISGFDIGPDKVQVSLATFSGTVSNTFWLNQYQTKADVLAAIKNATYGGGTTATDLALTHALTKSLSPANGARNNSNKIIIVLTDGQSTNSAQTVIAANRIHNTNIKVIAIGIGSNIDSSELDTIGTDKSHVFTVANFSVLSSIEKEVQQTTCKSEQLVCKAKPADILFLLDTSGSESVTNFNKQLDFVKNFTKDFTIGPDAVQIAIATFATTTQSEFWFDKYSDNTALEQAIGSIKYRNGNTHTELALRLGRGAFTSANGARDNASHLIIILTDGQSTDKSLTKTEANNVHNDGIQVIAIGIGGSIDQQEIKDIASGDGDQNAFSVANFDALQTIEKQIQTQTCNAQTVCSSKPADVVFLLDTSSSEGAPNFQKQLDFVNNFAKALTIGPNNVQLSVVTFSDTIKNEFWLNQYGTKPDVLNAIQNVKYRSGTTSTGAGLNFIGQNSFLPKNGGRPDANQVIIVVTDGQSQDKAKTASEAATLHKAAIKVISVGVGSNIDTSELSSIASSASFVFKVANFDALQQIESEIRESTCKAPQPVCKAELTDLVFLLDSSTSEGNPNFKKQLTFVETVIDGFDIGANEVQVGVVTFSTFVHNRIFLDDYRDKAALKTAVSAIPYTPGNTATGNGLEYVRMTSLSPTHGARSNANQVVIVMTDGQSQQTLQTAQQAKLLRAAGAKVIAVGIGNSVATSELQSIATDSQHAYKVAGFDALQTIKNEVQQQTCNKLVCASSPADIVFVLDSSSSEGSLNFNKEVAFVRNFVDKFDISTSAVQISIVEYSSKVYPKFDLNAYTTKPALLAAIGKVAYISGITETGQALSYVQNTALTAAHGARPNVPKIVIVMTDGQSSSIAGTKQAAQDLHQAGVEVLAIGIGTGVVQQELSNIASDNKHVFNVANFDALKTIQKELEKATCDVQTTAIPTTTKAVNCSLSEKAEIVFLLDSSGSEGSANFAKELDFVTKFVNDFDIGTDHVQFGVIRFDTDAQIQFNLDNYATKSALLQAIPRIQYRGGLTYTNKALDLARTQAFKTSSGARSGVRQYVIVVTDGQSNLPSATVQAASKLKNDGVSIISIGIGSGVVQSELKGMATDSSHVFTVKNFDILQTIHKEVQQKTC